MIVFKPSIFKNEKVWNYFAHIKYSIISTQYIYVGIYVKFLYFLFFGSVSFVGYHFRFSFYFRFPFFHHFRSFSLGSNFKCFFSQFYIFCHLFFSIKAVNEYFCFQHFNKFILTPPTYFGILFISISYLGHQFFKKKNPRHPHHKKN